MLLPIFKTPHKIEKKKNKKYIKKNTHEESLKRTFQVCW
jgi:hypothetical protein